jgi:hypothetical protein
MPVDADRSIPILRAASGAVASARSVEAALDGLVTALRPHFPISRVSLRVLDPVEDRLEIRGIWSDAETAVGVGVSIPIASTSFQEVERAGRSVIGRAGSFEEPAPLLDQVLIDEGLRSWVVIPLRRDRTTLGALTVSSRDAGAFSDADLPFFDDLGIVVQSPLLRAAAG